MKNKLNEELKNIKYLFNYNRGRVISEQEQFESEEIDEEYDDDEEYKDRSLYDPYYGDDDEEYDYMVDPNAEETLPSFDSSSSSGKYLGMAKPNRDGMDTGEDLAPSFDSDGNFLGMVKPNRDDMELEEEEEDFNYLKDETFENREIETPVRPGIKTPTKPKTTPKTPYKPKPGPKPDPKARKRKGDMPDWLSFKSLGINLK
jgi:hypothetical protein